MRVEISVLSKPGGRPNNEDAFGFWANGGRCFCVVSDGAGGQGGGDVASKLAVSAALGWFQETPECSGDAIGAALSSANQAVMEQQGSEPQLANMRATAVVLALDATHCRAAWGHLGDSRLYRFRNQRVIAQTKDHSVVQNMIDAGYLSEDCLRTAEDRSRLFAALGQVENFEAAVIEWSTSVAPGDVFLLCTDGFWEYVDERDMEHALHAVSSGEEWLRKMEQQVLERGGDGQDNYSALSVWCSGLADDPDGQNLAAAEAMRQ